MNREDFLMLNEDIIYFDNGATSLKPKILAEITSDYYNKYSANAHRGDYDISLKVDEMYENTRELVKKFINAKKSKEIIFTSGTTDSLNKIIFGYFKYYLKENDEVLLTKSEHASNVLPWFELADILKLKIKYIDLDENLNLTIENLKKIITNKTKVISLAIITNVAGDIRPMKEIIKIAHENNILVIGDGAQSVAHTKTDVQDLDIDFLAFSAHKMYGPTGVGVLYGKEELLNNIRPIIFGGGMNATYSSDEVRVYSDLPYLLEAGTQNIAGVIGFGKIIEYLNNIGMEKIEKYELSLKKYAIEKLKEVKDIVIINENTESAIITFNIKDIFAQDLAIYLNKYNICVRAGNHCSKILKEEIGIKNTCRASLSFYNTKEEVDRFIEVLKNPKIKEEII
ncbi:MAG: cysteine desulfurase [Bacilli bacterium]|nr:cysteine desulfurase [Bacilli bacterium]